MPPVVSSLSIPAGIAPAGRPASVLPPILILVAGSLLWWGSASFPAEMPVIAPWDFSWIEYLGIVVPLVWYLRGLTSTSGADRPHPLRRIAFLTGVALIYATLQTRFVYLSQHMFFLNRRQHLGMHHLGPFLIALAWPGAPDAWSGRAGFRPPWASSRTRSSPALCSSAWCGSGCCRLSTSTR